jgi:hypothetical protein
MSILDEIRNRTAPKAVPERQNIFQEQASSPVVQQEEIIQSDYAECSTKSEHSEGILEDNRAQASNKITPEPTFTSDLEQLRFKLSQFPEIANRVPVRLEAEVKNEIEAFCRQEKITVETLLEALYLTCISKDTLMRQVTKEARRRLASRKSAGNIRSSITRLENITGS